MDPIPNTGGGISGFVAFLLWHVAAYLPFPRALIFLLVLLIRVVHLPFLWRIVAHEMKVLACKNDTWRSEKRRLTVYWTGWFVLSIVWCPLLVSFFVTPAGQALIGKYHFFLTDVSEHPAVTGFFFLGGILLLPGAMFALLRLESSVGNTFDPNVRREGPLPFNGRRCLALFLGGGMYATVSSTDGTRRMTCFGSTGLFWEPAAYVYVPLVVFPFMAMMDLDTFPIGEFFAVQVAFLTTLFLMEGFRMSFVYVLHKRMFG